jgi:hypothetical protein
MGQKFTYQRDVAAVNGVLLVRVKSRRNEDHVGPKLQQAREDLLAEVAAPLDAVGQLLEYLTSVRAARISRGPAGQRHSDV